MDTIGNYFIEKLLDAIGFKVILALILLFVFHKLALKLIVKVVKQSIQVDDHGTKRDEEAREKTIINIITTVWKVSIKVIGFMIILSMVGVNIAPLIAGASIFGVAIGFAGQTFFKDFIAGIFIILENQYRLGDYVVINQLSGTVSQITLRHTILRASNGEKVYIPNGRIELVKNLSIDYANLNLNLRFKSTVKLSLIEKIIEDIGQKLENDKEVGKSFKEPLRLTRLKSIENDQIVVGVKAKLEPGSQYQIEDLFYRYLRVVCKRHRVVVNPKKQQCPC